MPPMPAGVEEGILRGIYKLSSSRRRQGRPHVQLFGSGAILRIGPAAQEILAENVQHLQRTSGASPATTSCAATPSRANAGTCCIPEKPRRQSYLQERSTATEVRSSPPATTCGSCPNSSSRGSRTACLARHRRLRPQRKPRAPASALRGRRRVRSPSPRCTS